MPHAALGLAVAAAVVVGTVAASSGRDTAQGRQIRFTAAGDYGSGPAAAATLALIGRLRPTFHLALGDLSYAGPRSEQRWCRFVRARVGPRLPFEVLAGNHEDDSGSDGHIDRFAACLPDRMGAKGRYGTEYYFDVAGLARFILISPDLTVAGRYYYYGPGDRRSRWVRAAVRGARAKRLPWVIVGMHKNCLSVGIYSCRIYQDLLDLLIAEKVDLVLHAHDHTYQRSRQLGVGPGCARVILDDFDRGCVVDDGEDGSYRKGAGTVFVVNGAAGRALYRVNARDPEAGYFVTWMGANRLPRRGVTKFTVSAGQLEGAFVGSTRTSRYADRFRIRAAG